MNQSDKQKYKMLETLAACSGNGASSSWTLLAVLVFLGVWLISGPFLEFSTEWHQIMVSISEPVMLLMVFLLVRTQSKDTLTIQMKLNEVIAALHGANNQLISIENLSEAALVEFKKRYEDVATKLASDDEVSMEAIVAHEIVENEKK